MLSLSKTFLFAGLLLPVLSTSSFDTHTFFIPLLIPKLCRQLTIFNFPPQPAVLSTAYRFPLFLSGVVSTGRRLNAYCYFPFSLSSPVRPSILDYLLACLLSLFLSFLFIFAFSFALLLSRNKASLFPRNPCLKENKLKK